MRAEYFCPGCLWVEAQLSAWLSLDGDSGGDFPLYSSAPHDFPHEQLGHQLSLSQAAVEIPPGHGRAAKCIPKIRGSKDLLLMVLGGAGGHCSTLSSSGCQGAASSSAFMIFLANPSRGSAVRAGMTQLSHRCLTVQGFLCPHSKGW